MESDDRALLDRCRAGDQLAWEALVTRYQRLVYSVPRRAGLGEEAAADVFQQVFTTLVEHIGRIEQPERLSAWLVTTARRESWRVGRKDRAQAATRDINDEDAATIPDDEPLPQDQLQRLEEQHAVRLALDSLDERCRTLLRLLYYAVEPPPYTVIAKELGTRAGSIGPTRARCLEKLRRLLESR